MPRKVRFIEALGVRLCLVNRAPGASAERGPRPPPAQRTSGVSTASIPVAEFFRQLCSTVRSRPCAEAGQDSRWQR
jgi:hypothetical protein